MKIGFIALGIMGKPMARNLLKAGHQVVVSSHNQTTAAELSSAGATTADSPKQIAEQVELVITMLPNSPDVKPSRWAPTGSSKARIPAWCSST